MVFEFNIFKWATGFALSRATSWAIDKGFTADLAQNLQNAVSAWSNTLPDELELASEGAVSFERRRRTAATC